MDDPTSRVLDTVVHMLEWVRVQERIRSAMAALVVPLEALRDLGELDPGLAPEVSAAADALAAASEALMRASKFADARNDTALENLKSDNA